MAFNRYKYTKKDVTYKTTFYPEIQEDTNDIYLYSRDGDRMDTLAYKFYKDSSLWWIIAKANGLSGDSIFLDPAQRIRIPRFPEVVLQKLKENK